jgi:hypothetical protein
VIMGAVGMLPAVATLRTRTCTRTTRVRTSRGWTQQDVCGIPWRVWWRRVRNRAEGTVTETRGREGQQINAAKIG